jgi:hypothetical protein
MLRQKNAQYLTVDAFIASLIITTGIIIVLAARSSVSNTAQPEVISQDVAASFSTIRIKDLNNPLVMSWVANKNISNQDNTIMQQAAEFYVTNQQLRANEFLQNVTNGLVPPQYSFEILIDNQQVFNRTTRNQSQSQILVSSKSLVFGVLNRTVQIYGPLAAEVRVWQ